MHSSFQLLLCTTRIFRVRMRFRVIPDTALPAQWLNCGQKPCLIFPMRDDDSTRHVVRNRCRPGLHGRPQFRRAIPVAIEQDEDRGAIGLQERQPDG